MGQYPEFSDTELTSLLIGGDENAFETIYRRYVAELYRFARRNIANSEDCEEIIQEIFESLWARREKLGHVTSLKPYLYRMVKYKVIRYFQHNKVKQKYAEHYKLFEAVYDSMEEEARDPEAVQALMEKGLSALPDRCRQAVNLRLTENLSNSDIAKRMKIRKRTVENYMVTALSQLRASYAELTKVIGNQ